MLSLLFVSTLGYTSAAWYKDVYGQTGFDSVLYTLFSDLGGVEPELLRSFVKDAIFPAVYIFCGMTIVLFPPLKKHLAISIFERKKYRLYPFRLNISVFFVLGICFAFLMKGSQNVQMGEYIKSILNPSHFFQEYYVDPNEVELHFPEQKQNLIYILMESMETTFFAEDQEGALNKNVIPELYQLARENVNFSHNKDIGGFISTSGTGWTIASMVAHTAGIPLKVLANVDGNEYGKKGGFLPGLTSISNILSDNGYYQCLMVGSDAEFGGRRQYYSQHGVNRIYDHYTAMEDGIIPHGYDVWWGMEDKYLFEYAKQELTEIAKMEQPFSFTLLTVDTHHIGGYVCDQCQTYYSEQYENVFACSSKQIYEFVQWIQAQEFYENTTIILAGDHPTMDGGYIERNVEREYERHVYNCFINSCVDASNTKDRIFTTEDMFPTTLAAIGCEIDGNRLGLGTNLFSSIPTLMETMGISTYKNESSAFSSYYMEKFAKQPD